MPAIKRTSLLAAAVVLITCGATNLHAAKIYWAGPDWLGYDAYRANLDGSQVEKLPFQASDFAVDPIAKTLYWIGPFFNGTFRGGLDGSNPEKIANWGPDDMALDPIGKKIYAIGFRNIFRGNLDGSNFETVVEAPGSTDIFGMTVDPIGRKVYWAAGLDHGREGPRYLARANLDGTGVEHLLDFPYYENVNAYPFDIDVDPVHGKIYWAAGGSRWDEEGQELIRSGFLFRANLDGMGFEVVNDNLGDGFDDNETEFALDVYGGKAYVGILGAVFRLNLDGSGLEHILNTHGSETHMRIAIDPTPIPEPSTLALAALGLATLAAASFLRPRRAAGPSASCRP